MKIFDMAAAGKICAIKSLFSLEHGINCFESHGFTRPCAAIWTYNAIHDSKACFATCVINYFTNYNGPPPSCKLNNCLDCDEEEAGPLFKKFAGRSSRNSGLESAITRKCGEVR